MSYRKYLGDYRIEEYLDEKGRVKTKAIYIAGDYALDPDVSMADRRMFVIASIAGWCAYIGALSQQTSAARWIYVIVPFTLTAFPLIAATLASISLYRAKPRMTRKEADKTVGRLQKSSLLATIFPSASFIGFIVTAAIAGATSGATPGEMRGEILMGDIVFVILSLITAASGALIYAKCRKLKAVKIEEKNKPGK